MNEIFSAGTNEMLYISRESGNIINKQDIEGLTNPLDSIMIIQKVRYN